MSSEKSSFSQTCSLLRQYLLEKGSLGELSLGMSSNHDSDHTKGAYEMARPVATTMNLFPVSEKPVDGLPRNNSNMNMDYLFPSQNKVVAKEPEAAQMTIFYSGRVIVIDDLSAEKAKEIMLLAGQQTFASNPGKEHSPPAANAAENPTRPANAPTPPKFGNTLMPEHIQRRTTQPIICDLPIQRKASLHRFLEKRKDRINRSAPYQASSPSAVSLKPAKADQSSSGMAVERDLLSNLSS